MKTKNLIQQSKRAMKSFSLFTLLFSLALASCSKSDDVPTAPQGDVTTFTLAVEGVQTRGTTAVTPARYIMEVWSEDGTTAENVFGTGDAATHHAEITSDNAFTAALDKTKAYTCLFWADDNAAFNAASLKAISLNADKSVTEAYFSKVAVAKGKNPAVAVTLKRAVAKITLTETGTVKTDVDLALKFSNIYPTFSVLAGEASGTAAEWTKTVKPSTTKGVIASFYLFAKAEKALSDLTFTYATETEKTVSNIPVQQNHATNVKGEFSNMFSSTFTITADDEWTTPENDVELGKVYKLGDIYPNATAPIGVVFWVDESDATYNSTDKTSAKGKIVGLIETTNKMWGSTSVNETAVGIDSETDGATATKNMITAHKDETNFATDYSAFEWVYTTVNNSDINGRWYIPAKEELKVLYGKYSEDDNADNSVKTAVNASLSKVSGAIPLSDVYSYWSSTQQSNEFAWSVSFEDGYCSFVNHKSSLHSVRVVSAF